MGSADGRGRTSRCTRTRGGDEGMNATARLQWRKYGQRRGPVNGGAFGRGGLDMSVRSSVVRFGDWGALKSGVTCHGLDRRRAAAKWPVAPRHRCSVKCAPATVGECCGTDVTPECAPSDCPRGPRHSVGEVRVSEFSAAPRRTSAWGDLMGRCSPRPRGDAARARRRLGIAASRRDIATARSTNGATAAARRHVATARSTATNAAAETTREPRGVLVMMGRACRSGGFGRKKRPAEQAAAPDPP